MWAYSKKLKFLNVPGYIYIILFRMTVFFPSVHPSSLPPPSLFLN